MPCIVSLCACDESNRWQRFVSHVLSQHIGIHAILDTSAAFAVDASLLTGLPLKSHCIVPPGSVGTVLALVAIPEDTLDGIR